MEYQQYYDMGQRVAQLVDAGDHAGALEVLRLLLESDISDLDKAQACMNAAVVYEKTGQVEQALASYDRAMDYEYPHSRFGAADRKAAYLVELGREAEALALYEALLQWPALMEINKYSFRHNVTVLKGRLEGKPA